MSVTRDQILEAAKAMTPAERYDLIEDIRQILDDDDELSPDQMAEVQRRIDSSARGDGDRIASDEAVEALREKLRQRRRRRAS
jgi:hypothetical protein